MALDQNAINADPSGYAKWLQGAQAQEQSNPGSTALSPMSQSPWAQPPSGGQFGQAKSQGMGAPMSQANVYNLGFGGMNPYTQNAVNSTMGDMARNYNLISRPQQETAMAGSGSFGNSGLQQMRQQDDYNQAQAMGNVAGQMQNNAFLGQQQFGLQAQNQLYNQQMGNQQYGLQAQNQGFSQDLANRNFGLNANQQAFNQDFTNRNFDANQYWTGQNFDAGRFDTSFDQNRLNLSDYMAMMKQANEFTNQDITNSTNVQNTPLDYWKQFTNSANGVGSGYGTTTSGTSGSGNPWIGALGGWSLANSIK